MWLYIAVIPIILSTIVGIPLLMKAGKKGRVFLWEYLIFFCPVLIWDFLTLKSVGSQSLSNVIEVYLVVLTTIVYSIFRLRRLDLTVSQKALGTVIMMIIPVALRLLFPSLPE